MEHPYRTILLRLKVYFHTYMTQPILSHILCNIRFANETNRRLKRETKKLLLLDIQNNDDLSEKTTLLFDILSAITPISVMVNAITHVPSNNITDMFLILKNEYDRKNPICISDNTTTDDEDEDENECSGCYPEHHPKQRQHMGPGGCLQQKSGKLPKSSNDNVTPLLPQQSTSCYGCSVDHPSQLQHMGLGGCLDT
eukprot:GHVN01013916.1.p2 GENE.GHVN01013916.1~~GHVN01013916.1.p2  ORF type:complete len:197 (+),score=18.87 GHVN01013916.1:151-741(+)